MINAVLSRSLSAPLNNSWPRSNHALLPQINNVVGWLGGRVVMVVWSGRGGWIGRGVRLSWWLSKWY